MAASYWKPVAITVNQGGRTTESCVYYECVRTVIAAIYRQSGRGFVQVLITDVGLLPIKVWEWMLLQRCSHFSFSDWTEKKWTEISSFWSAEQLSFCTFSTSPLPLWWANFKRPSDQSLAAVSVALLLMKKCVPFLKKTNKQTNKKTHCYAMQHPCQLLSGLPLFSS